MPSELVLNQAAQAQAWRSLVGDHGPRGYAAGIELIEQGGSLDSVYLIAQGLVKLTGVQPDGRVTIVGVRSRGWIVGAAAAIRQLPCAVTATTLTRCQIHRVAVPRFLSRLRRSPSLSWYLHELHSRELYEQLTQELALRSLSARERLERFLAGLLPEHASPDSKAEVALQLPLRLWEVAQLISVTPTYLSSLLGQLEAGGLVRRNKGQVTILRPGLLSVGDA